MFYSLQHHVLISNACNWKTAFGKKQGEMCVSLEKTEPFICTKVQPVEKLLSHTFQNICVNHKCTLNRSRSQFQKWSLLFKELQFIFCSLIPS